jgi:uncharacterized protein YqgC (DUF456 family)
VEPFLWFMAACLVVAGVVGVILPAVPGPLVTFAGLLLAAWIDDFDKVGVLPLAVIGCLSLLSFVVDVVATAVGAGKVGASRWALLGAGAGTIIGLFFGFGGIIFGPFLGAVLGEILAGRTLAHAGKSGLGTWIGIVLGIVAKLTLVCVMIGIFVLAYLY